MNSLASLKRGIVDIIYTKEERIGALFFQTFFEMCGIFVNSRFCEGITKYVKSLIEFFFWETQKNYFFL